jgi:hypothetical protein
MLQRNVGRVTYAHVTRCQLRRPQTEGVGTLFMFAPCINSIKAHFINPTDAHNYRITGMLKQLKFSQLPPDDGS